MKITIYKYKLQYQHVRLVFEANGKLVNISLADCIHRIS